MNSNFELKQISHYMFFPPVELCSRGKVSNGNKPNEQTVCLANAHGSKQSNFTNGQLF